VCGWGVNHLPLFEQCPVGREPLAVALAVDDDPAAGVGEPVVGAALEDRIVEETEPLFDVMAGGEHKAGRAVAG